jgi:hypothetical protein
MRPPADKVATSRRPIAAAARQAPSKKPRVASAQAIADPARPFQPNCSSARKLEQAVDPIRLADQRELDRADFRRELALEPADAAALLGALLEAGVDPQARPRGATVGDNRAIMPRASPEQGVGNRVVDR